MKAWWLQLNSREQQLFSALAAFIVIFLFFNLVWKPLDENINVTRMEGGLNEIMRTNPYAIPYRAK